MPTIVVDAPPLEVENKRQLVKGLTETAIGVYGNIPITVLIKENPAENVGVNGELLVNRRQKEGTTLKQQLIEAILGYDNYSISPMIERRKGMFKNIRSITTTRRGEGRFHDRDNKGDFC